MKLLIVFLALLLIISCSLLSDASQTPPSTFDGDLSPEYTPFNGKFNGVGSGYDLTVDFDGNGAFVTCVTANTVVYFNYTIVLTGETITTYNGSYPIIWWFECKNFPYEWTGTDILTIIDPVNSRTLVLYKELV